MLIFARLCSQNQAAKSMVSRKIRHVIHYSLGKYLFIINSVTCGTLMAAGDTMQQKIEKYWGVKKSLTHDWERTGRMFNVGLLQGPPQHFFYGALDRFIPSKRLRFVALKILLDQLIASPTFLLIFFVGLGFQEGRELEEILSTFVRKFKTVYMVDWCVWPPSQFINFYFLPPQFRVLYISVITMLYNCFLSFIHHGDDD